MSSPTSLWPRSTRSGRRADRLFDAALERVKELAAAYAAEPAAPAERSPRSSGHHSLAARAARSVSDAAAGIASVLVVAEAERGEAERLVGAHRASVHDKDPLAPIVVAGKRGRDFFSTPAACPRQGSVGAGRRGGQAGA